MNARPSSSMQAHSTLGAFWNLRRLPEMAADPLGFFTRTAREQGGVAAFDFGPKRQWLLSDPDAIRTVFIKHHDHLGRDRATLSLTPLFGEGLLTSAGAAWKRRRKIAAPSFRPAHLRHYGEQMIRAADASPLTAGTLDPHAAMVEVMKNIILHALFDVDDHKTRDIAEAISTYVTLTEQEFMSVKRFLPAFVPTPARRQGAESGRRMAAHLTEMCAQRRANPGGMDILSRLIDARDEDGGALSDEELCHEVATLFFGGFETSAGALGFAMALLAERPDVQDLLAEERREVLGDRGLEPGDVRKLVRHSAVIDETMRLFPPVWGLGREVLRPIEVGGHRLEAGHQLNASAWVLHRDPQWWEEPESFRPERFWSGQRHKTGIFVPYGVGPRLCIGQHFAKMETVLVLAEWLKNRRLHPVGNDPIRPLVSYTLKPAKGTSVNVEVLP